MDMLNRGFLIVKKIYREEDSVLVYLKHYKRKL